MNQAVQLLSPLDTVLRRAFCSPHKRGSSSYIGTQEGTESGRIIWLFKCREGHTFGAYADPLAPKTVEESTVWLAKQRQARLAEVSRRK